MSSLYELYNKRTKYKALRENVTNAINVLSNNSSIDNHLTSVDSILSNNYLINDVSCKGNLIRNVKECLNTDLRNLEICLSSINTKIYNLTREIEEKEAQEALG